MNDQNQNPIPAAPPTVPVQPQMPMDWKSLLAKGKPMLLSAFNKFYANKKIFWPVSIAFGLILFVIILGLLFGKKGAAQVATKTPSPAPFVLSTPQASSSGNILIDSQTKLNDLKNQINALDINESRLSPPPLDFNVKF